MNKGILQTNSLIEDIEEALIHSVRLQGMMSLGTGEETQRKNRMIIIIRTLLIFWSKWIRVPWLWKTFD